MVRVDFFCPIVSSSIWVMDSLSMRFVWYAAYVCCKVWVAANLHGN